MPGRVVGHHFTVGIGRDVSSSVHLTTVCPDGAVSPRAEILDFSYAPLSSLNRKASYSLGCLEHAAVHRSGGVQLPVSPKRL